MTSEGMDVGAGGSGGRIASLIDALVTILMVTARRVAKWLTPVAIGAGVAGLVVWGAVGAPLLDDEGSAPVVSLVIAVLALAPVVLVLFNRFQLRRVARRAPEIRSELNSLVSAFKDKQAAASRLVAIEDRLEGGGVRELIAVGHDVRDMQSTTDEVREHREAILGAFGLTGFAGLGIAVGSAFAVMLAAPVAIIVALVMAAA